MDLAMSKRRSKLFWLISGLIIIVGVAAVAVGPIMSRVEQPEYLITASKGAIEVRSYDPMISAQATVHGKREDAINEGFRLIAAYIFGANKPNAKIEMTAPVQQQRELKIAMTAPVTQQADGDRWTVEFIMPKRWTMETLPAPEDDRVKLVPVLGRKMVVIRFSGSARDKLITRKTAELRAYANEQKLDVVGEPVFAFYNPPWTLPFLRRNEVMFQLASK
ncbi:MAG: hypothetical protein ACI89J_003053 [Hyphomicrobiaceae bacterium]|jgi:hypothetical protein